MYARESERDKDGIERERETDREQAREHEKMRATGKEEGDRERDSHISASRRKIVYAAKIHLLLKSIVQCRH